MGQYFTRRLDTGLKRHIYVHDGNIGKVFAVLFHRLLSVGGFCHDLIVFFFDDASKHQSYIGYIVHDQNSAFQNKTPSLSKTDIKTQ